MQERRGIQVLSHYKNLSWSLIYFLLYAEMCIIQLGLCFVKTQMEMHARYKQTGLLVINSNTDGLLTSLCSQLPHT